jgi:glycine/D-amino acid oxidase-like deaminating enzyme
MRVLICGGGVIGASIAYFLSRRGVRPIVIERTGLACAASGKAGGFLGLNWCDGTPLEQMARRSFDLHARLSGEVGSQWGYRRLTTYSGQVRDGRAGRRHREPGARWLSDQVTIERCLGTGDTTAQVQPERFTTAMMRAAQENGAELRIGQVTGLVLDRSGTEVAGVNIEGNVIPCDAVVIALGPWSRLAARWLPLLAVYGLKGHSLVYKTGAAIPGEALFLEYQDESGLSCSPEVFPRPDGTTYVCAISSDSPVPLDPADVAPDEGAIERLEAICARLSPVFAHSPILARQACFRPITRDGLPLIGPIPGVRNAWVATGHSVWGILNAPATGEALAELIVDGQARMVDLAPFDPGRLRPSDHV